MYKYRDIEGLTNKRATDALHPQKRHTEQLPSCSNFKQPALQRVYGGLQLCGPCRSAQGQLAALTRIARGC